MEPSNVQNDCKTEKIRNNLDEKIVMFELNQLMSKILYQFKIRIEGKKLFLCMDRLQNEFKMIEH